MKKDRIENYILKEQEIIDREFELIEKIVNLRVIKGISQRDLCKLIDISQPALARIEKLKNSSSLNTILKILAPLGYSLEIVKQKK